MHSTLVIRMTKIDSEAVECASEELSETMYDPFGVVGLVCKRKVRNYYSQLITVCCVLKIHLEVAS